MLILSEHHLRSILKIKEVIDAVEEGFRSLALGEAHAPERLHMKLPEQNGILLLMPSQIGSSIKGNALGAKIVSVFEDNAKRGLDIVQGIYILLDGETGSPIALMDGRFITAIRTAATSAVATRLMASSGRKRLAVLGAGVQAEFHIEAMIAVAEIEQIFIASRSYEKAESLAKGAKSRFGIDYKVTSIEEAIYEADLICACTSATSPLFDGSRVKSGSHINAVGSFTPATRELDTITVTRSRLVIDDQSAAGREAGEILIPLSEGAITTDHIKGTLSDIVTGKIAGRTSTDEITLFKSCGLAIEDLVTAQLAYSRTLESGIGVDVEI